MKTFFSEEMLENCVSADCVIAEAKEYGKKFRFSWYCGIVVGYQYNGKLYLTEIKIVSPFQNKVNGHDG